MVLCEQAPQKVRPLDNQTDSGPEDRSKQTGGGGRRMSHDSEERGDCNARVADQLSDSPSASSARWNGC